MKRNKSGISLIVLVITIIIMIILAGAIIIILSNSGIIGKANEVVEETNLRQVQEIARLAWSEAYIDKLTDNSVILKDRVFEALDKNNIDTDKYDIIVTEQGVTVTKKDENTPTVPDDSTNTPTVPEEWKASVREVTSDGVPIPIGFVKSPYANEGTKNGGLVIYALTPEEISQGKTTITDTHQTALETRNQFVWVPVEPNEFETKFVRSNFGIRYLEGGIEGALKYKILGELGEEGGYWELVLDSNNIPSTTQNTSYVSSTTLAEATKMYSSVKKYGGFYIARYEVGINSTFEHSENGHIATRVSIAGNTNNNLSVTSGKYPYNVIEWGTSTSNEISDGGAVSLARAFYPTTGTTYGVVSTLTYGVQWDRTLNWWKELNPNIDLIDSASYGVYRSTTISSGELNSNAKKSIYEYSKFQTWTTITEKTSSGDWLFTTGAYKKANVYNIYDMAGNLAEWTMEGVSTYPRVMRGGHTFGGTVSVLERDNFSPDFVSEYAVYKYFGFRPSLYIK